MKSLKPRNKAQRKVDYKNYDAIAMSRNYYRKLSASTYINDAENVGIIGILAYQKKTLFNLYKDIVLVTRLRNFFTTLFTNNNIKIIIQFYAFQLYPLTQQSTYFKYK